MTDTGAPPEHWTADYLTDLDAMVLAALPAAYGQTARATAVLVPTYPLSEVQMSLDYLTGAEQVERREYRWGNYYRRIV